jgi:hypothetical protein
MMYEDLEQIAQLKFGKAIESISSETRETVAEMENRYAALAGSSGIRSGQQIASIGRAQIDGAERLVNALFQIWIELVKRRRGHIAREDVTFIANKVDGYARSQKGHLHKAFTLRRTAAVLDLLTQQAEMRMQAVAANARRELEIMVREHEAFPAHSNEGKRQSGTGNANKNKEDESTRRTAEVLNILIASPSDVTEEREVVERAIQDWNAAHFLNVGVILYPIRWESHTFPASGERPQAIINKQIVDAGDVLIGIFGYKLGTPTGAAQSGTIEEIEKFRKDGKYVALYFSTAAVPRTADRDQLEALEAYKKDRRQDTLYFEFEDAAGLHRHLTRHLPKIVDEVRKKLNLFSLSIEPRSSPSLVANNASQQQESTSSRNLPLLADLISELEDNFDCASRPITGDVYRRPSIKVWHENRNKISLPQDLFMDLKSTYSRIGSWADVVASGLNPNLGSMPLELVISDLRSSLPSLIDRLRKFQDQDVKR